MITPNIYETTKYTKHTKNCGAAQFSTQRLRGTKTRRRPEEETTAYTEHTERGATALCLCVFVSLC